MITITLNQIINCDPCDDGWEKILAAKEHLGMDTPWPLADAIISNGFGDTLWALRCLPEHDRLWRKYVVWCARQVQHLMTDPRSLRVLDVAWLHSDGLATDEELDAARAAAWDAAQSAARGTARDAAWAAAARSAAWAAAWSAAGVAAARGAQQVKLIEILNAGEWVE